MEERRNGQDVTLETRHDAHEAVDKQLRYKQIKKILAEKKALSAKEVAVEMRRRQYTGSNERNNAAPRLTELCKSGDVEVIGKKRCQYTGKMVSVYQLRGH